MTQKSVIVIGAGLAGLSAGCYLQMNGYRTRIFEQHTMPGGVAACWERKGYLIDGGIHFIMNFKPGSGAHDMFSQLGTAQANRFIEAQTYARFINEAGGGSLEVTADLEQFTEEVEALSSADATLVEELVSRARGVQALDLWDVGLGDPPELMGMVEWAKMAWQMRSALRFFVGSYRQPVRQFAARVKDPWVRFVLENVFLPEVPVWFLVMLLGMLANGDLGLLEGGSLGFVSPIEQRYRQLGGEVSYGSNVAEVLVEKGSAIGVRLSDGSEHHSDVVVSAADGHSTIFKMLGGRYVDKEIGTMYRKWQLIRPAVMVSYGVARQFNDEPWLSIIRLDQPFKVGQEEIEAIALRIFNYSGRFAPPGKTVIQASLETEWDHWERTHRDLPAYAAEKERVAQEVLLRLESHYPGISGQVEVTDVATPCTTWRYTRNWKGAYMGWLPTPDVMTTMVRRTLPGLGHFLMAGQWVMPGGGVAGCLYSGRHVAQILCRQDGKPFLTTVP